MIIFTICANNYLAQAIVLGKSVKENNPNYTFQIFLCDVKSPNIDYNSIGFDVIELSSIEVDMTILAQQYNIIELNTAVKPTVFQYLFNQEHIEKAVYMDPDTYVFDHFDSLELELNNHSIILTPHILTTIAFDGKIPDENVFLNYGTFNLGFIALKSDKNSAQLLHWWKTHTYENGYIRPENGVFVDQLPMNLAPILFNGVKILKHLGYNMAPWNLHERYLTKVNGKFMVDERESLTFYHFSSFKVNKNELPGSYNRFKLVARPDLKEIYEDYNDNLIQDGFFTFSKIKSFYSSIYEDTQEANRKLRWQQTSTLKKSIIYLKRAIPISIKNLLRSN